MPLTDGRDAQAPRWESTLVPGPGGTGRDGIPVRIHRAPATGPGPLVWAHGGGWRAGSVEDWHPACAELAVAASATVISVGYRLAPRHPHPAALLDVLAVMDWAQRRSRLPIAVGGDSAGGTVAACAALVWRDERRRLAAQILAYAPIDPGCEEPSYHRDPRAFPHRAELMAAWREYRGSAARHPAATGPAPLYSTPAEADDLTGLAPAILAVGALDPVVDDVRGYAQRLRDAGNRVELTEFENVPHGAFLSRAGFRRRLGTTYARRTT
ncbi:alpha/beta hydrolase [Streptomyces lushanensis]|uniref:alpha/beta hydrolase n=1 Tax=Streptomyces lushanensis TaxID=1434255 RepID=UPI000833A99A|nr:alpha/beta hydrolase [Streptomyces lushanensis]